MTYWLLHAHQVLFLRAIILFVLAKTYFQQICKILTGFPPFKFMIYQKKKKKKKKKKKSKLIQLFHLKNMSVYVSGVMLGRTISSRIKSFRMRNKAPVGLSRLVCPNGENIRITDAKSDVVQKPLSTDEIFRLNRTCNCRPTCGIPEMITARPPSFYSSWQLTVIYECGGK